MRIALVVALVGLALAHGVASAQGTGSKSGSTRDTSQPVVPKLGPKTFDGKTLQDWIRELTHGDASRRAVAILAILQPAFYDDAWQAVPHIIKRLNDTDLSPRAKACMALRYIEVKSADVPKVVQALGERLAWDPNRWRGGWYDSEAVIRYEAAVSLRRFAPDAAKVIPQLINGTRDRKSWEIRHMCAATLWRAALSTEEKTDSRAVKALLTLFANPNATYQERLEVIVGLGSLGKSRDPALQNAVIKQLMQAATTNNTSNRPLAIWAYAGLVVQGSEVQAKDALVGISRFLKSNKTEIRSQAVQALGALGKDARSRLPLILATLNDPEATVSAAACQALVRMGDKSDKVTDALLKLADHKDINRSAAAIVALANLKANSSHVLDSLDKLYNKEKARNAKEARLELLRLIQQAIEYIKKEDKKPAKVAVAPENADKVEKVRNARRPRR